MSKSKLLDRAWSTIKPEEAPNESKKRREEYAKIIGDIPPFLELSTLHPVAAKAQVEQTIND